MFATVLRLLLCLCLLLDAVAPAVAASRMALGAMPQHAAAPSTAAGTADAAPPAAHDCGHGDGAAMPPAAAIAADDAAADATRGEREDCLRVCLELCLQNGHALAAPIAPMPALLPAIGALPFDGRQAATAPAFPPIRPPIG